MDDMERAQVRRASREARLRKLGVRNVRCVCGETDPLCFDAEHINRRAFDGVVRGCCANCHRKKSERERTEHPTVGIYGGNGFERMAHRNLGAVEYLTFCVEGLRRSADVMLRLAAKGIDIED